MDIRLVLLERKARVVTKNFGVHTAEFSHKPKLDMIEDYLNFSIDIVDGRGSAFQDEAQYTHAGGRGCILFNPIDHFVLTYEAEEFLKEFLKNPDIRDGGVR